VIGSRQFDLCLPPPSSIVLSLDVNFGLNGGRKTMINLIVNGRKIALDVEPEMPLLWALRDELGMVGTKFGCGAGLCGACTVIIDGEATRSCITPVSDAADKSILTIEGLGEKQMHAVQKAWIEADAPQCGYCQSGQIMAAVALLSHKPNPSDDDIDAEMSNICRCGTYPRMRAAVHRAAELAKI
jgi:isoquinoline 1-oxidoreductase alpha subunit